MGLLKKMGTGQGFLKAGFLGFAGSGKTYTALLLAAAVRAATKANGPVAMVDTEGGAEYIAPMVRAITGKDLIGIKTRAFQDLLQATREAEAEGISVLVVDSITHIWRELSQAYMNKVNESLRAKGRQGRTRMEIQDIMAVKDLWAAWPDLYLNAKLHIIICGRAGFEWDMEEDQDTGKKKLVKTGVKMKVESEFGFEPSLLVEMERRQDLDSDIRMSRQATVLKERFGVLDGAVGTFAGALVPPGQTKGTAHWLAEMEAVRKFFAPHLDLLTPGAHNAVDVGVKSDVPVDDEGNQQWAQERKTRKILVEEIQAEMILAYPGQSAKEKLLKLKLLEAAFGHRSWARIEEASDSGTLRIGLEKLRELLADRAAFETRVADQAATAAA